MLCVLQIIHVLINANFPLLKKITVVILVSVGVKYYRIFSSVQLLSHVQHFATPWTRACLASLSIANFRSSLKLTSIKSVIPSSHLILSHLLLLLPSIFPSIRVFSSDPVLCIRWTKYWSFSFNIIFRAHFLYEDRLDLLAVQETLKSLIQHHSSKA